MKYGKQDDNCHRTMRQALSCFQSSFTGLTAQATENRIE